MTSIDKAVAAAPQPAQQAALGCGPLSPGFSEALVWAAGLHRDQARKGSRIPYLSHLMAVSAIVLEDGGSETEAIAGLLHDAVEDRGVEVEPYLQSVFGDEVAAIVKECSDAQPRAGEPKPPWRRRKTAYIKRLSGTGNFGAVRVSAADKLHNARATLHDVQRDEGAWSRFNACVHQQLWYYGSIAQVVSKKLVGSPIARDLNQVVGELFEKAGIPRVAKFDRVAPYCPASPPCANAAKKRA